MPDLWSGSLYRLSTEPCKYIMRTEITVPSLQAGNQVPLSKAKKIGTERMSNIDFISALYVFSLRDVCMAYKDQQIPLNQM